MAVADLVEYMPTPLLDQEMRRYGSQRVDQESMVLDFSWRLIIEDDRFRYSAAKLLAQGLWPSQVDLIKRRYIQVVNEKRWPRALAKVDSALKVRGPLGIMDEMDRNRSLVRFRHPGAGGSGPSPGMRLCGHDKPPGKVLLRLGQRNIARFH